METYDNVADWIIATNANHLPYILLPWENPVYVLRIQDPNTQEVELTKPPLEGVGVLRGRDLTRESYHPTETIWVW